MFPWRRTVLLSNSNGTFQLAEQYGLGARACRFTATTSLPGDFDGDGQNDLAVLNGNEVDVLLGNGNGTFQPPTEYAQPTSVYSEGAQSHSAGGR